MSKKSKAIVLDLSCPCGYSWTAAWPTGKLKRVCKCRGCGNFIKTDGSSSPDKKPSDCSGCKRPLINNHHCTYCGRPVNEKVVQVAKEPAVMFCPDNSIPSKFRKV